MTQEKQSTSATAARSVELELTLDASPDTVWRALTDAEELTRWFPLSAEVTPGPGGRVLWAWEDIRWETRVEVWEPGKRLRLLYNQPPGREASPPAQIAVDFLLEGRGGKTLLRLVHSGFGPGPEWEDEYDGVRRGWNAQLRALRHYLQSHPGAPRRVIWFRVPTRLTAAETWAQLFSSQGLAPERPLESLREGDPYRLQAANGDVLTGAVHFLNPPQDFVATVANLNRAHLVIHTNEQCGGTPGLWLWLSTWGLPAEKTDNLQQAFSALLRSLFSSSQPTQER